MEIDFKNVTCVYSGKAGACMCGCSGKYYYASEHREYSSKERGYKVTDEEINNRMVKKVFNLIKNFKEEIKCLEGYIFSIVINNRQYVLYLKKEALK